MQLAPMSAARHKIRPGVPLPFNIRNPDGTLLLARGKVLETVDQVEALEERGAMVEGEESPAQQIRNAPAHRLPSLWGVCMSQVGRTLGASIESNFTAALDEAAKPVLALIERDPDLAIFQLVQQDPVRKGNYAVTHSMHTAMAAFMVARRLAWSEAACQRAFKASLTMNMGMMELQGLLANQITPITAMQRAQIREHPERGVEMLQGAGIADDEWLTAVAQHHETPDGSGYPHGVSEVSELGALLRFVDVYTAKLSIRATRSALAANDAARVMFAANQTNPIVMAIVKEFGLYPPGCYVTLASGELGIVVRRGANANTPVVAALVNRKGEPMIDPIRRDTSLREHAIVAMASEKTVRVRVPTEKLVMLG